MKWRTNPKTAGPTFVLGDIGTHLYYLSEIVLPHLKIGEVALRPQGVHSDPRAARRPCDRPDALRQRRPRPTLGILGQRRQHGLAALSLCRFEGVDRMVRRPSRPVDLRGPGEPNRIPHHGMPYLQKRRASPSTGCAATLKDWAIAGPTSISGSRRPSMRSVAIEAFLKTHHYPDINAGTEGVRWLDNCVRSADKGAA